MKMRKDSKIALAIFLVLLAATIITPIQIEKARIAELKQQLPKLRTELKKHIPPGYEFNRKIPDTENAAIEYEQAGIIAIKLIRKFENKKPYAYITDDFLKHADTLVASAISPDNKNHTFKKLYDIFSDYGEDKATLTDKDIELAIEYFEQTNEIVALLDNALAKQDCVYVMDNNNWYQLGLLRCLARHMHFRALTLNYSNPQEAVKCIAHTFHIGNSMRKTPEMISSLIRMAIMGIGCSIYQDLPRKDLIDNKSLESLIPILDSATELLITSQAFVWASEAIITWQMIHSDIGDFSNSETNAVLEAEIWYFTRFINYCNEIKATGARKRYDARLPDDDIESIYHGQIESSLSKPAIKILGAICPAEASFNNKLFQAVATLYATKAAIQIELFKREHNRLPNDTSEITGWPEDPFTPSGGLKYLITKEGFKVYSVGEDGMDDGGDLDGRTDFGIEIKTSIKN